MEDPELNRNYEETKELQVRWGQFRDFMRAAMAGHPITAAHELKFMDLKSRIAMLHDGFAKGLRHEERKTGQMLLTIISESIMLRRIALSNESEKQKFEYDWNDVTILLTEHLAALEMEKERLAAINPRAFAMEQRKKRLQMHLRAIYQNGFVRTLVVLGVLFGIFYFLVDNGTINLDDLISKPVIGPVVKAIRPIMGK